MRPTRRSWSAVLYLLSCVGLTSADGIEKSQYRVKVFCENASGVSAIFLGTFWARSRASVYWRRQRGVTEVERRNCQSDVSTDDQNSERDWRAYYDELSNTGRSPHVMLTRQEALHRQCDDHGGHQEFVCCRI